MISIFNFISKNWVPIASGATGIVAGFFAKKTELPSKTGNMITKGTKSTTSWIKGLFTKNEIVVEEE